MKTRKNNSEFSWFIVGFILTNILLYSTSKISNTIDAGSELTSTDYNKYAFIESRQNYNARSSVKMPSYRIHYNTGFGNTYRSTNISAPAPEIDNHIEPDYNINVASKRTTAINNSQNGSYGAGYFGSDNYTRYSNNSNYSSQRNENSSNNVNYSELTQSINQLAGIKSGLATVTESQNTITKSDYGFVSMKTDLTTIGASLSMSENTMQKASNDNIDPGGSGEMGEPIPVGDGWIFMLLLAVGYVGFKKFRI
jgi:hypothetical protein